jgi:GDP-L-fucose synthase
LVYPESSPSPLVESYLHAGRVSATHLGIGTAKRDQILMSEMYHREHGLNAINVLASNAYGPGDRFDPVVSHVIPATIMKCYEQKELVVWGDGSPTRDFLYVEDLAEGLLLATENLNAPDYYVNISSGQEISIKDLVNLIARLSGFKGAITFDPSKGGGDPSRRASGQKARESFGFVPRISMEEGLSRTIACYLASQPRSAARA